MNHKLVKYLNTQVNSESPNEKLKDMVEMLYETALLSSGYTMDNTSGFVSKIHKLLALGFSVDDEENETYNDLPPLENTDDVVCESALESVD